MRRIRRPIWSSTSSAQLPTLAQTALPDPLADPREDIRIDKATARGYLVERRRVHPDHRRRGTGMQRLRRLQRAPARQGHRARVDATATRSMIGLGYPGPGLFSKFFDHDLQPLIEVVRDTVGRHDAFGLACTPRYYDDVGYPGHVNCTENMNAALQPSASRRAAAGRRSISSTIRASTPIMPSSSTSPGRGRATMCCCGR